ncbi:Probable siderophore transport system ATP-binding protein YusV [Serratia rubidaea]|uniref:Probable siderophore transport system ATP-binding protein YusV n=1 Tax=Serratia rubidaea TaxID=61652 RepID=A0A3S4GGW5_SERRU|nr:Probable siderophore transport system ATP-binding protein YusV [Serratia rubidaea]
MNTVTPLSAPLRAENLTLGYDKKIVASDLSVAIPHGELTVIIGPNACGKSTLLRTLSRLMQPQQGQVWLNDKPIRDYATKRWRASSGCCRKRRSPPATLPCSIW